MRTTIEARIKALQALSERTLHGVAIAGMLVMTVAILIVIADVALRHTVKISIMGTVDITQLCVMAAAFWAIPYTYAVQGHVKVELFDALLPRRMLALLDLFAAILAMLLMAGLCYYGGQQAVQHYQEGDSSQTIGIPMIWYWSLLVSGCFLSCLATAIVALGRLAAVLGAKEEALS